MPGLSLQRMSSRRPRHKLKLKKCFITMAVQADICQRARLILMDLLLKVLFAESHGNEGHVTYSAPRAVFEYGNYFFGNVGEDCLHPLKSKALHYT